MSRLLGGTGGSRSNTAGRRRRDFPMNVRWAVLLAWFLCGVGAAAPWDPSLHFTGNKKRHRYKSFLHFFKNIDKKDFNIMDCSSRNFSKNKQPDGHGPSPFHRTIGEKLTYQKTTEFFPENNEVRNTMVFEETHEMTKLYSIYIPPSRDTSSQANTPSPSKLSPGAKERGSNYEITIDRDFLKEFFIKLSSIFVDDCLPQCIGKLKTELKNNNTRKINIPINSKTFNLAFSDLKVTQPTEMLDDIDDDIDDEKFFKALFPHDKILTDDDVSSAFLKDFKKCIKSTSKSRATTTSNTTSNVIRQRSKHKRTIRRENIRPVPLKVLYYEDTPAEIVWTPQSEALKKTKNALVPNSSFHMDWLWSNLETFLGLITLTLIGLLVLIVGLYKQARQDDGSIVDSVEPSNASTILKKGRISSAQNSEDQASCTSKISGMIKKYSKFICIIQKPLTNPKNKCELQSVILSSPVSSRKLKYSRKSKKFRSSKSISELIKVKAISSNSSDSSLTDEQDFDFILESEAKISNVAKALKKSVESLTLEKLKRDRRLMRSMFLKRHSEAEEESQSGTSIPSSPKRVVPASPRDTPSVETTSGVFEETAPSCKSKAPSPPPGVTFNDELQLLYST